MVCLSTLRSSEWQETHDKRKSQLYENKDDGEFWMSCHDFQENFSCLYICNRFPINLDQKNRLHERWSQMMFKNRVIPGNTAGSYDIGNYFAKQEAASPSPVLASGLSGP